MQKSVEERLAAAQAAFDGALADSHIQATLIAFGYSMSQLQAGQALYQAALALRQKQKAEYGNVSAAHKVCAAALAQAEAEYTRCSNIAEFVFRTEPSTQQKLGLLTPRPRMHAKLIAHMRQFYTNALLDAAILSKLSALDLTQEMLEEGQRLVDAFQASNVIRRQHKGDAKHATKERDEAMVALDRWMRDFRAVARAAFREQPQSLTKLGISAR